MSLTYVEKYRGGVKVFGPKGRIGTIVRLRDDLYQFKKKGDAHLDIGPKFPSVDTAKQYVEQHFGDEGLPK